MTDVLRKGDIGRPVPVANYHVTLAFLGNVPLSRFPPIVEVAACVRFPPFILTLDRYGYFPRAQVAWLGCTALPAPLARLVSDLRQGLLDAGWLGETRGFRTDHAAQRETGACHADAAQGRSGYCPHLTVARKMATRPQWPAPPAIRWKVGEFVLVESRISAGRVEYQVIDRYPALTAGE